MQVKMIVFPGEEGLDVLIWGKWTHGAMRCHHFDDRTSMIATLENLQLLSPDDAQQLETFAFTDSCPLYSAEVEEEVLAAHGFAPA
jgi:hypothetical protein